MSQRPAPQTQLYLRVVDNVLENQQLNAGATLLYMRLFQLAGKDGYCGPSQTALARACKSSVRAVQGYITKLADSGYIQIERDGGRNVYRLCPPLEAQKHVSPSA